MLEVTGPALISIDVSCLSPADHRCRLHPPEIRDHAPLALGGVPTGGGPLVAHLLTSVQLGDLTEPVVFVSTGSESRVCPSQPLPPLPELSVDHAQGTSQRERPGHLEF